MGSSLRIRMGQADDKPCSWERIPSARARHAVDRCIHGSRDERNALLGCRPVPKESCARKKGWLTVPQPSGRTATKKKKPRPRKRKPQLVASTFVNVLQRDMPQHPSQASGLLSRREFARCVKSMLHHATSIEAFHQRPSRIAHRSWRINRLQPLCERPENATALPQITPRLQHLQRMECMQCPTISPGRAASRVQSYDARFSPFSDLCCCVRWDDQLMTVFNGTTN